MKLRLFDGRAAASSTISPVPNGPASTRGAALRRSIGREATTVRGPRPPAGTITLATAATLPGLSDRSLSSLRMHLAPVRTGQRWCGPGHRKPWELYDEREVRRIADALRVTGGENPYLPNKRLHTSPRTLRRRSTAATDMPEGWVTTAHLRDHFQHVGNDVTVKTIRRILAWNCNGPPRPDALDAVINDGFGVLLDEAGQPRPPLRVPSMVRLVGQRLQRVYPEREALEWVRTVLEPRGESGRWARQEFRSEHDLCSLPWRRAMGWRNPWLNYVKALGHDSVVTAHRIAAFVLDRKKLWSATCVDAAVIASELRDALVKLAA